MFASQRKNNNFFLCDGHLIDCTSLYLLDICFVDQVMNNHVPAPAYSGTRMVTTVTMWHLSYWSPGNQHWMIVRYTEVTGHPWCLSTVWRRTIMFAVWCHPSWMHRPGLDSLDVKQVKAFQNMSTICHYEVVFSIL